jgi:hypothetical protein
LTLCCGIIPEPVTTSTEGEFEALLAKLTFADAEPEVCGANVS